MLQGNIPGNISGYQIHDENLIVEVSLAPQAVDERTTMPPGHALVLVHEVQEYSVRLDYTTYTLPESSAAQGHSFESIPRVTHEVCST